MCRLSGSLCVGWSLLALGAQLCSADWPSKASLPPLLIPMDAPAHGFQDIYHNPSSLAAFFSPFFYRTSSSRTWQGARDTVNPCVCVCLVMSLCNTMDYSPPCFSVHDISQPRIPEWVAISYPGDLPNPGIEPPSPMSPALAGKFFTTESENEVAQSCPTLCNPMDCSLPGSSIHGVF